MAIQNGLDLIFGKYNPGQIGSLRLDAMLNERQSYKNDVTMFPVENGSRISDHVIQASEEVTITGFVSNTPISVTLFSTVQNAIQGTGLNAAEANNTPSNVLNAYLLLLKMAGYKYPNKVFDKNFLKLNEIDLDQAAHAFELVDIITGLRVYTKMAMTSLDIPRDADTGDAIEFTASFRKVTLVETKKGVIKTSTVKTSFKKQPISKNEKGTPGTESTPMQDWFTTIIDSAKKSLGMSK